MASQGTSKLAQIQMRFQQKQSQIREQRKIELTTPKTIASSIESEPNLKQNVKSTVPKTANNLNASIGNGKVRQMFNERRRGAGIDRSNPLKPITTKPSLSPGSITPTAPSSKTNIVRKFDRTVTNKLTSLKNLNGNDSVDYMDNEQAFDTYRVNEDDFDMGRVTSSEHRIDNFETVLPSKLEALVLDSFGEDTNNNHELPNARDKLNSSLKLNPVLTKKSPPVGSMSRTPASSSRSSLNSTIKSTTSLNAQHKLTSSNPKTSNVKSSSKMSKPLASPKVISLRVPRAKTPPTQPPGTAPCKLCNRFFNEDRLAKHEEVCEKMANKKRKIFDASKHRVKGTEAEKYLKKPLRTQKLATRSISSTSTTGLNSDSSKKSNWRKKHEEFIAAIRAAKEVQAHLAKGGKLSDLPPPAPSENPDYITCPHCMRRFNEAAANRHIPKCANMLHNKPKMTRRR